MNAVAIARRPLTEADFARMHLPEEYWRSKIQEVAESVREPVQNYLVSMHKMAERGAGLIVGGGSGVGKTGIAALVAKEARSRGFTVFFTTIWELREYVRSRIMFDDSTSVLDRCREVDVLVLDNLRAEDATEMMVNAKTLEDLLASRGSRRKISILTTRMSLGDLRAKMPGLMDVTQGLMVYMPVIGVNKRVQQHQELDRAVFGSK